MSAFTFEIMDDPVQKAEKKNSHGNTYYQLKQYANAIFEYSSAIQICPQIAKYYGNRSACYLMMNEFVKALADSRKSIELNNGYQKGYIRIGKCCLATGDIRYAETVLAKAKGIFPEDNDILEMYKTVINVKENLISYENKMEHKKYEEALNCIQKCIEMAPFCLKYITNKGKCLIFLQRYDEAKKIADEVLQYKSIDEDALYIKAVVQINQKDPEEALDLCKELKKKLPDNSGVTKLFRSVTMIQKNDKEIKTALKEKDYCSAYELLSNSIKMDETRKFMNKRLYKQKIEIAGMDKKLLWKGIADCSEYMLIYEKETEILKTRAEYYMQLEEYEDAEQDYKELMNLENSNEIKKKLEKAEKLKDEQLKHDHKILKIRAKATTEEIKKATRDLMLHYHADKNNKATPERKKKLDQKLIRVRTARENLLKKAK